MSSPLKTYHTGFTLVELVVVIGIFVMMAGLALFNFRSFQTTRSLDATAQELTATLRESQIYGIAVRGLDSDPTIYPSYGMYAEKGNLNNIIFFSDLDGDRIYDDVDGEKISTFTVEAPISVFDICTSETGEDPGTTGEGNLRCMSDDNIIKTTAIFKRPDPEPHIYDSDTNPQASSRAFVRIDLVDKDGFGKSVYVWKSGQVGIANPWQDVHFAAPTGAVCPVVHIWDGEKYVMEHKVASFSSVAHEQTNVVPFETIGKVDDFIKVRIREDIDESYIDRYALIAVDSPVPLADDLDIQLDSFGTGKVSRKIEEPLTCETHNGESCKEEVANKDGIFSSLDALGDDGKQSMTVSFKTPIDTHTINLILKTRTHDVLRELAEARLKINPSFLYAINLGIKIPLIKDIVGIKVLGEYLAMNIELWNGEEWVSIGSQSVDDYRDINTFVLPLPKEFLFQEVLQFRLSTNGQYFIDEIGIGVFEDVKLKVREAELFSVTRNDGVLDKQAKNALLLDDGIYHVVPKGTYVDLVYKIPKKENIDDRRYFSLFNGYLLVDSEGGLKGIQGVENSIKAIKNIYQGDIDSIIE